MNVNYEKVFSRLITVSLLGLAAYYQSAYFAYAAVLSFAVGAVQDIYSRMVAVREQKPTVSEEVKRALQDINARVATLEYGVKQRGF